jgi:outer membrane protein assembly factor BamB
MRRLGFEFLWKLKLKSQSSQQNSLMPPALFDFYIGYRGFRTLAFVGSSSGRITAIDVDLARIEWEKNFAQGSLASAFLPCPGGMTSGVTRPTLIAYATALGRGFGRSAPAKSGVGEPFKGAVTLKAPIPPAPPPSPPPPSTTGTNRAPTTPDPYAPTVQYVHAISQDGQFHSLYVSNGEEPSPPRPFLPPNANAVGLIVFEKTAYVATVNGCGDAKNGIWALNLDSGQVTHWESGRNILGSTGFAVGPDGTIYVAAESGELVALAPGTLAVKSSHKSAEPFSSSPVVFEYKGRDLIAVATSSGRVQLFDTAALDGQPLAETPVFSNANFAIRSLASWQDSAGTRWVLSPAGGSAMGATVGSKTGVEFELGNGEVRNGATAAFRVVEDNGGLKLQPAWVSRDMVSPLPPAVVNGIVFALSSGEFRSSDIEINAAQRAKWSSHAILYALDAATGKELWNSGDAIASFVHAGGPVVGGSRVYVEGSDENVYVFGFPMEH